MPLESSSQLLSVQAAASWSVLTSSKPVPGGGASLNVALTACCDSNQARAEPLPRELFWGQGLQVKRHSSRLLFGGYW